MIYGYESEAKQPTDSAEVQGMRWIQTCQMHGCGHTGERSRRRMIT